MPVATVEYDDGEFRIECKSFDAQRAKNIPNAKKEINRFIWKVSSSPATIKYLNDNYTLQELSQEAASKISQSIAINNITLEMPFPEDFKYKNKPRPYQMDALNRSYGMTSFALFMEMRTGKSYVDICLASCYYEKGDIDAYLIVLFPGALKSTWKLQLEEHMPSDYELLLLQAGKRKQTERFIDSEINKLKVMVVGIESLSQGSGPALIQRFADKHKVKFTIDESTCIKNPKAVTNKKTKKKTRVKLCWDVGADCVYRMIMTGTPLTQGIEDLYSQFRFLDWQILNYKSYYTYSNAHCILGGFERKHVIGYRNIAKVVDALMPYVYQISTKDAIGIPDEVHETIYVEQSLEQKRMLKELGNPYDMSTSHEGNELEVETILERMIRYQQIVGGHFPWKEGKTSNIVELQENPKLEALMAQISIIPKDKRVIIWARFVPEIYLIAKNLESINETHIIFRGGMTDSEREHAQTEFMSPDGPRFWVASQQASARGVELATASIHIFYSNSFSYDDRKQATMRTSSSHQKEKSILYIDITMNHKIDKQIIASLQRKKDMADYITEEMKNNQEK